MKTKQITITPVKGQKYWVSFFVTNKEDVNPKHTKKQFLTFLGCKKTPIGTLLTFGGENNILFRLIDATLVSWFTLDEQSTLEIRRYETFIDGEGFKKVNINL